MSDLHKAAAADDLFRRYVEKLHEAQASGEAWDWIQAGSLFKRFADVAVAACIDPQDQTFSAQAYSQRPR